jgi:hypothetical protein
MPIIVECDQCCKDIGYERNAYFSNRANDLDFCSKICYNRYNSNYNYCQVSSCLTKLYDGSGYCQEHVSNNDQERLKSLVKNRTSLAGNIEEVERFTT